MAKDSGKQGKPANFAMMPQASAQPRAVPFDEAVRSFAMGTNRPVAQPQPDAGADRLALRRRDWLLDVAERQRRLSPRASALMRVRGLSGPDFLDHFYAPGRPVVIEGAFDDWPALKLWTPEYLAAKVGGAPVEFQGGRSGAADFELAKDRHKQTMPFDAFMAMIARDAGNDAYITAYNNATNAAAFAPLQADLGTLDAYLTRAPGMMWIGPAGTFTPLHFDLTNNLLIQLVGRKQVRLVSPAQTRFMYHRRHVFSAVHDLDDPSMVDKHPLARNVASLDVTLVPGDALYIPIGWWHQVRSLDFSVMLTCTNFLWPNEGHQTFPGD